MTRVLVAGIGNIFLGDDGFGVEVVRRLVGRWLPEGVEVADIGVRGLHLAYQLLEGYDVLIAVDTISRGGAPGTIYVLEPDVDTTGATPDAHAIDLAQVFAMVRTLGGQLGRVLVVGCEPAELGEQMGLSPPVERAVEPTVQRICELAGGMQNGTQP